jgi:hypothetical protein
MGWGGLGLELVARDVQADLVTTEMQRLAVFVEGHEAHAESFYVEPHRRIKIAHGQHQMVESCDHRISQRAKGMRNRLRGPEDL